MGRGPSLKTELKKLKKNIETRFKTKLKLYQKYPAVWIGDRLADIAKQTGMKDVTKIIAVVGMTILVKRTIDMSEDLRGKLKEIKEAPFPFTQARFIAQTIPWFKPYERVAEAIVTGEPPELPEQYEGFFPDWMDWIIAFTLAYIIVENFGQIMHSAGNITSSIHSLLSAILLGGGTAA